jgi:transcriptional regulator with XRE-family HTH domain
MKTIKQKDIAAMVGVSPSFISQLLRAKKRPSWQTAKKLAGVTGTLPALWMDGTPRQMRRAIKGAGNAG